jgi:phosphoribosylaminoimidazole-succinocarboxamide synthase
MLVLKAEIFPVECVARGYLSGCWKEYQESGGIAGMRLPPGLRESDRLPEYLFRRQRKRWCKGRGRNQR